MTEHERHIANLRLTQKVFESTLKNSILVARNIEDEKVVSIMQDFYNFVIRDLKNSLDYAIKRLEQVS